MKIKNIKLDNFGIKDVRNFQPTTSIKWYQDKDAQKDNQTFASILGNKQEINKQLASLNNKIIGDRVRTLNNIPKSHVYRTKRERIY
jgi:hypothetical protein